MNKVTKNKMAKLYRQAKLTDRQKSEFVCPHIMAMTGEKLHYKSEIAYELGARDKRIAELENDNKALVAEGDELDKRWISRDNQIAELEKENKLLKEVEVIFNNAPDLVFADCKGYFPEEFKVHNLEQQIKAFEYSEKKVSDLHNIEGTPVIDMFDYFKSHFKQKLEELKDNT